MATAQPLADTQPQTPDIPDNRRITEHDPRVVALKAKTVRKLQASVKRLLRDLRPGSGVPQGEAQSQFIHRHVDILRAAYIEAHRLGQRQYFDGVSRDAAKWAREEPDAARMARTLAFYAPSVAKIAHEAAVYAAAVNVQQSIPDASHVAALSDLAVVNAQGHSARSVRLAEATDPTDAYEEWQQGLGARIMLQADLTWSGAQDGYVAAGWGDSANPYSSLWWNLEPIAQHCSDCPVFAAGSPYDPPWVDGGNILNATPGDGNTECGAACRCDLSYGGSLGYTRTQDWKAWLPQNMPDAPDGPMEPVQPPAGKQPPAPPPEPAEQPSRVPPSPFELPEGVRRSPYGPIIPGGEFTDGQKAALDLYRLAELEWNDVRGPLPELPNFFTLANPNFSWPRLKWEELTKAQQKALSLALEAWFRWSATLPEGWQDYYDEDPYAFEEGERAQ